MRQPLYDQKALLKQGLVTNGYCLPYNPKLVPRAIDLRKHMTKTEEKLWLELIKDFPIKISRQKVIHHYIVDFYCARYQLVIEIDGAVHDPLDAKTYDQERTNVLEGYGLKVIRFKNEEIEADINKVRTEIMKELSL